MNKNIEFPFANARRITPEEVNKAKIAIKQQFGEEYTVRENENDYEIISFKINQKILDWAKQEAEKEGGNEAN